MEKSHMVKETQRHALDPLSAEEMAAAVRILRDFGRIVGRDVDHRRLQLLGELGELVAELHRVWNHQRRRVGRGGLPARGMHTGVDERSDDDPDRQRNEQKTQRQQLLLSHHLKPPHGPGIAFLCRLQ